MNEAVVIVMWLILTVVVGAIGSSRQIGFGMAFLWSFLLSPVVGLIIVLCSESNSVAELREKMLYNVCPYCGYRSKTPQIFCPNCGRRQSDGKMAHEL